jgi:hypothetical protein
VLSGNFKESLLTDPKEAIDEEESAEHYGYLSDSDLEDDDDELKVPAPKRVAKSNVQPSDSPETPGEDKTDCEDGEECVEKLRVIKIQDTAFVT